MLTSIENEFNFIYPSVYKQLYEDQMLDWLQGWNAPWTKEKNWYTEVYPRLKARPPLLLHNNDFELLPLPDVAEALHGRPAYWDRDHQFIPFGKSGGGDWYAFYYNLKEGDQVPIAFVWHDLDEVNILAASLNDFIFRQMLEITHYTDKKSEEEEREYKTDLLLMLQSHRQYLSKEKQALLEHVYQLPVREYAEVSLGSGKPYYHYGMLASREISAILKEHIGFPWLDHTFSYQVWK